jgi:hypothetical protein
LVRSRWRSKRAFATHQDRLPKELALVGISEMVVANRYPAKVYRPRFNVQFAVPVREEGSAFVPWIVGDLEDLLYEQLKRTIGNDNCARFEKLSCQIAERYRYHYVKAPGVHTHRYPNDALAIFQGPRKLARHTAEGKLRSPNHHRLPDAFARRATGVSKKNG